MNGYTIMIVDDESQMRELVRTFLEAEQYHVVEATDGVHALDQIQTTSPDLLIVDVMMPYMDGFLFAEEVKRSSSIPIIFLSAKGDEWDRVKGLKLGGDDYIVKPFLPAELVARVESVLRRTYQSSNAQHLLKVGPFVVDSAAHTATVDGKTLSLTLKEFGLLQLFLTNRGRVYTREQLLELIWDENHKSTDRTVDTHIKTLRLKLGEYASVIETVWGVGYKLEV
ncbi:response regulator transcription factor [Sporosarcina sp. Marseille-Q4063]|uniref:response regulator transcription factor n=1 Tax=Sporosarcina sp. Marseille-Q4063 TaxID=2810514 RepID=UPI001BAFCA1E|nr:response regulator transcription factor [Sporosarcina sp. Marseille-Q4063]QUW22843.1 response regulator transcription factor [Sporosarcina sp. Marseille-Q4063]